MSRLALTKDVGGLRSDFCILCNRCVSLAFHVRGGNSPQGGSSSLPKRLYKCTDQLTELLRGSEEGTQTAEKKREEV